jgi:hypothetical protein
MLHRDIKQKAAAKDIAQLDVSGRVGLSILIEIEMEGSAAWFEFLW